MQRDMKLIKLILQHVRRECKGDGRMLGLPDLPNYEEAQVVYHIDLCEQAGYITAQRTESVIFPITLTWSGHEELATCRSHLS